MKASNNPSISIHSLLSEFICSLLADSKEVAMEGDRYTIYFFPLILQLNVVKGLPLCCFIIVRLRSEVLTQGVNNFATRAGTGLKLGQFNSSH